MDTKPTHGTGAPPLSPGGVQGTPPVSRGGVQGTPPVSRGGVQGTPPVSQVEGDGISYSGIVWFVVILTVTTVVCQILMWVLLRAMQHQAPDAAMMASPMAPAVAERQAPDGRVYPDVVAIGTPGGPAPQLLVHEPVNLETLRAHEHDMLTTYGVTDKNTGTYRIPIERAKDLLLEHGLPVRGTEAAPKDVKVVKEVKK